MSSGLNLSLIDVATVLNEPEAKIVALIAENQLPVTLGRNREILIPSPSDEVLAIRPL